MPVGGEGRGDEDAVAEAVHAVAGDDGPAACRHGTVVVSMVVVMGMVVAGTRRITYHRRGRVFVPVVPEFRLVEQEKEHHPQQQCAEQYLR